MPCFAVILNVTDIQKFNKYYRILCETKFLGKKNEQKTYELSKLFLNK